MSKAFRDAMAKLAVLGQDTSNMIDCSEVIPEPKPLPAANSRSVFPPGFTNADLDQAVPFPFYCVKHFTNHCVCQCASTPFPYLPTKFGQATPIAPV
jgi:cytochrome c peroxidase